MGETVVKAIYDICDNSVYIIAKVCTDCCGKREKIQMEPKSGAGVEKGGLFGGHNGCIGIKQADKKEKVISVSQGNTIRRRETVAKFADVELVTGLKKSVTHRSHHRSLVSSYTLA